MENLEAPNTIKSCHTMLNNRVDNCPNDGKLLTCTSYSVLNKRGLSWVTFNAYGAVLFIWSRECSVDGECLLKMYIEDNQEDIGLEI